MLNTIQEWWLWYTSSGLGQATLTIPMVEITLLLIVLAVCLLFRFSRIGLLVAYIFLYRWGWIFRSQHFLYNQIVQNLVTTGYIIFGIMVFLFAVTGMIRAKSPDE